MINNNAICPNCKRRNLNPVWIPRVKDKPTIKVNDVFLNLLKDKKTEGSNSLLTSSIGLNYGTISVSTNAKNNKEICDQYIQVQLKCSSCGYIIVKDVNALTIADAL